MKTLVQECGYVLDPANNIWIKPTYESIAYSDGDEVEERIASAIQQTSDLSILSTELRQHCTDWPSLYHLSATRANIMRPFENILKGDVLEIGAGCGAITRYLGECGANVLALEGSPRRAAIVRSRTRDLENITVLAERFEQFQCDYQFDVITLIGVLEYANLFTSGENPPLAMLERVRSLLKPEGKLIIAIENQLGLKYFAGAPEDHLGLPMFGIEGRYRKDQPQTFGRNVLTGLLEEAGFSFAKFLAPFPDYKLPISILTEQGISCKDFDASAFAWQSARRDPQLPVYCNFSLELAWPAVFQNELGLDVANSFLIVASPNAQQLIATGVLAYHYSTDRIPEYCKETVFIRSDGGDIRVKYRRLGAPDEGADKANNPLIRFTPPDTDEYASGKPLSLEFIHLVTKDGWSLDQVAGFIWRYLSIIGTFAKSTGMQGSISPYAELPGEFFDAVPQNIIIRENGEPFFIDKEWMLIRPMEVGHLLFRSLLLLVNSITRFGLPKSGVNMTRYQFFDGVFATAGLKLQEEDYVRYNNLEAELQQTLSGRAAENFVIWNKDEPLPTLNLSLAVAECDRQIGNLNQAVAECDRQIDNLNKALVQHGRWFFSPNQVVAERDRQISSLNQALVERDGQISSLNQALVERGRQSFSPNQAMAERDRQTANLNHAVATRDLQIASLISSNSWRLTRPLRFLGRMLRGELKTAIAPFTGIHLTNITKVMRQARSATCYVISWDFDGLTKRIRAHKQHAVIAAIQAVTTKPLEQTCWGIMATQHTLFIAHLIADRLREHGYRVDIMTEVPKNFHHDWYVLICPQMFAKIPPMEKCIVFQMEQSVNLRWFTDAYVEMLKNSLAILEYALVNIDFMASKGIVYPHVNYLPVGASVNYGDSIRASEKTYDVLFYGDSKSSPRRREMLDALRKHFNVRVISEVFGRDMLEVIQQARLVINLHYYENALLEMPRIQECLSLGVPVVSESAQDQKDYPELVGAVRFFEQGSIPAMLNAVKDVLENPVSGEKIEVSVAQSAQRFAFMFDRFLVAMGFLPSSQVNHMHLHLPPSTALVALSLPETIERRRMFEIERPAACAVFDGIRRRPGWVGCGLSYVALAHHAKKHGVNHLTIMEDDVILPPDFENKFAIVEEFLDSRPEKWDIFAGIIAALHSDAKILAVDVYKGITFVTINKMTSMVFNIYSEKALSLLATWDPENLDSASNTIDRFLENQTNLRVVVTLPFFVGHREEAYSTLWGFQNSQYNDMIANSEQLLESMMLATTQSSSP